MYRHLYLISAFCLASLGSTPLISAAKAMELNASASGLEHVDQVPSKAGLMTLIHATMIAVELANKTGNYIVFRQLASPAFQEANSVEPLADIFKAWRLSGVDLSS